MTILITGFEVFGNVSRNPSQLVVEGLVEMALDDVVGCVLPVSYDRAAAQLTGLLEAHNPTHVLMLGLATKAKTITLEQVAINLDDCESPDNDGDRRLRDRIECEAPAAYWSSLPLERMASIAEKTDHEILFSHDAGGYVCNHIFFRVAHIVASRMPESQCGFVHLPLSSGRKQALTDTVHLVQKWLADWKI